MTTRDAVLAYIHKNPGLRVTEIAEKMHCLVRQVQAAVQFHSYNGRIHCMPDGKGGWAWHPGKGEKRWGRYDPRTEVENAVPPRTVSKLEGFYYCPELRMQPYRAGSDQARNIPSRGFA